MMKKPDFFIVVAPQCGTSAMDEYLSQHPDIFMSKKDFVYFGSDLGYQHPFFRKHAYEVLFSKTHAEKLIGNARFCYFYSQRAAIKNKKYQPSVRIIITLRNLEKFLPNVERCGGLLSNNLTSLYSSKYRNDFVGGEIKQYS